MKKRRKKIRKKRAHKRPARTTLSSAGAAFTINVKKGRGQANVKPGGVAQFVEVKKFIHLDMDAHPRKLFEKLRKRQNAVFVLSDTSRKKPLFYISSSQALRVSFRRAGVNPAPQFGGKPPSVADLLRPGMKELVPVKSVFGDPLKTTIPKGASRRSGHMVLRVKNDKPSAIWTTSLALAGTMLPSAIKTALIAAIPKVLQSGR